MTKKLWKVSVSVGQKSTAVFDTLNVIAPNDRDASRKAIDATTKRGYKAVRVVAMSYVGPAL